MDLFSEVNSCVEALACGAHHRGVCKLVFWCAVTWLRNARQCESQRVHSSTEAFDRDVGENGLQRSDYQRRGQDFGWEPTTLQTRQHWPMMRVSSMLDLHQLHWMVKYFVHSLRNQFFINVNLTPYSGM